MSSENPPTCEKSPSESHAEVIVRMFPSDANPAGNVFGGEILKHIDMVAGIVAQRHSQSNAVTVSMDSVNFLKPVFVGNVLKLNARINYVHNSSMEIEVKAEAEDGKPMHVPRLSLKTDDDRIKFEEGKTRMEKRLKNRQK